MSKYDWDQVPFEDILADSKDGEWGIGEEAGSHTACWMIRGTDFAGINDPSTELPLRWIPDHLMERKRLQPGDVVFEMAGGTAKQSTGRSALVSHAFFESRKEHPVLCASFCRHLRLKPEYHSSFIYYLLQTLYRAGYMGVFNIQHTGVSRFQYTAFKKKTVLTIPKEPVQKKIAAILTAYDDLIEVNQRRIAALETMAEELYREWFVRLRFPGHAKVKLVKGVPEGWERGSVSCYTSYLRRGVAPVYDDNGDGLAINQKCIRGGKLNLKEARKQSRDASEDRYVRVGDVLVNSTGEGTLGRVAQVLSPINRAIVDSHVTIVRPKDEVPVHYFGMTLRGWEPHLSIMGQGSTNQTELSPSIIGRLSMLMPPQKLSERFEEIVSPIFKQSELLRLENDSLRQTRDLLLPRLISGKLRVEAMDIQFPPGMAEP